MRFLGSLRRRLSGARLTFREAAPHYLAYASTRKKPSTLEGDVRRLRLLCAAPWAGKILATIRPADFLPWMAERQKPKKVERKTRVRGPDGRMAIRAVEVEKPGASGATLNRDLALASAVFGWARRAGYVDTNPVRRVERFSEKGREREVYLTAMEANALIDECSPALRPFVLTAIHTGMRRGELLALKWRAVDLERGELLVEPETEKTGRGRVVPLTDELHAELTHLRGHRSRPALDGSDPVFGLHDGEALSVNDLRRLFPTALKRCTIIPLNKRGRVSFHTLRHTAASIMVAAGVPLFDVAKILGHSTLAVTMRYAHFAPEAGQSAVARLGDALTSGRAKTRRAL